MPNWCSNHISVSHEDPAMMAKFIKAAKEENIAETFIPMPSSVETDPDPSVLSRGAYDWRLTNWGTKWDFGIENLTVCEDEAFGNAETAWSPPVEVYQKLSDLGFTVHAMWHEGGMCFAGIFTDGECTEYDNIQYTEEYLMNNIDESIVEAFNLYDMIPEEELS